jgi:hypothetical protein
MRQMSRLLWLVLPLDDSLRTSSTPYLGVAVLRSGALMFKRLAICIAVLAASGCAAIDNSFSPRVSTLNFGVDRATNDAILTNIIRASRFQPLTFVGISKVSGSQQASLTNGLPTLTFGANLTPQQKQFSFANNSINQQAAGNFDVVPLASREFTKGLLLPLSMLEFELLLRQGFPRELLFNLVVEAIEFTWCETFHGKPPKRKCEGKHMVNPNNPADNNTDKWYSFQNIVKKLVSDEINVESREQDKRGARRGDKADQVPLTMITSRFCFDSNAPTTFKFGRQLRCGTSWYYSKTDDQTMRVNQQSTLFYDEVIDIGIHVPEVRGPIQVSNVRVQMRSIYGIFRYLGQLLVSEKAAALAFPVSDRMSDAPRYPLLQVETGPALSCFASVQFDAEHFCVPESGSPATNLVFSILAQLIALKTQPGDLAFTPTVRVAP